MNRASRPSTVKRPVNLTMNADLVERAREAGLNLSALAEGAIATEPALCEGAVGRRDRRGMCSARALPAGIRVRRRPASGSFGGRGRARCH
jgi:hypothetical protein